MQRFELQAIPVVDAHGSIIGIISRTNVFAADRVDRRGQSKNWKTGYPRLRAQDIMSRKVQSALLDTILSKLVHIHMIVPDRGLTPAGQWILSRPAFLLPCACHPDFVQPALSSNVQFTITTMSVREEIP